MVYNGILVNILKVLGLILKTQSFKIGWRSGLLIGRFEY